MTTARTVEVLNADCQSLGKVSLNKAIRLLVLDKAVVEEPDESRGLLRETSGKLREWAYPKVVRLVAFVKLNYKKLYGDPLFSKNGVLKRDKHSCCYCLKPAKTIDHVLPRSRGGANNYMNTVASCFSCNNKKDNMTPKEAGMAMHWQPYVPTKAQLMGH